MSGEWQELVERVMREEPVGRNPGFKPQRIVITKGCYVRPHWRAFVEKVCAAFPDATVDEQLARNHMEFRLTGSDRERRALGKRTLVLGTIQSAVRRSAERGIACPNYWHFSTTAFCWYDCAYCYLAGSCSTVVSPTVKVFVNLEHILAELQGRIAEQTRPTSFYLGKLQDALSLDWLTGYSMVLVPFFAAQENARLVMLTKSACVDRLLGLRHNGHAVVSWSVNPDAVCRQFEAGAPSLSQRLSAARKCSKAGYATRLQVMPLVPVRCWQGLYAELISTIFQQVKPQRITLGGLCSFPSAFRLTAGKLGSESEFLKAASAGVTSEDGRRRYAKALRIEMYRFLVERIRRAEPGMDMGLCLEDTDVWTACGFDLGRVTCNCIWDTASVAEL